MSATTASGNGDFPAAPDLTHPPFPSDAAASGRLAQARRQVARRIGSALRAQRRRVRLLGVVSLDFAAVLLSALIVAFWAQAPAGTASLAQVVFVLPFSAAVVGVFVAAHLYNRSWRFLCFADGLFLAAVVVTGLTIAWLAALVLAPSMAAALSPASLALQACLLIVAMGSMRILRRSLRELQRMHASRLAAARTAPKRTLLLGSAEWSSAMLDLIRADAAANMQVVGILLPAGNESIRWLSRVPVLGTIPMLASVVVMLEQQQRRPERIIICDDGRAMSAAERSALAHRARALGLELGRLGDPWNQLLRTRPRVDLEELPLAELLGRAEITIDRQPVAQQLAGRRILVTGAGGTIGGELIRQIAALSPAEIVLLDHSEYHLYAMDMEIRERFPDVTIHPALCCIREAAAVRRVFARHMPDLVFHAAALKHVPLVEVNPSAGAHTNVIGTRNVADAACEFGARAMVQVSTDKAVNPVGMMGATKRLGELYCQALDLCGTDDPDAPRFLTVRFGNVLGSSGSIVPLFLKQLAEGKPLTVTHPDIARFFMTVKEAVQLILQSSLRALEVGSERGNIFVLDMGQPVRIADMARRMIRLTGLEPEIDVGIKMVGLRPGEKLYEELFDACEERVASRVEGVLEARSRPIALPLISRAIDQLERLAIDGQDDEVRRIAHNLVKLSSGQTELDAVLPDIPQPARRARAVLGSQQIH